MVPIELAEVAPMGLSIGDAFGHQFFTSPELSELSIESRAFKLADSPGKKRHHKKTISLSLVEKWKVTPSQLTPCCFATP